MEKERAPKEVFLLIFEYLLPTEKTALPLVCQHWLKLTTDPQFAQDSFKLFKPLSQKRILKGSAYLLEESFRLEKKLPQIIQELAESPYFFNLGKDARGISEQILRKKFNTKKQALCLIRNSSHAHMIAISYIDGRKNLSPEVDISISENSLNIQPWLNEIPKNQITLPEPEISQESKSQEKPKKAVPVSHAAVYLCEDAEGKKIQFIYKSYPDVTYESLELLIQYLKKSWCIIKKR